MKKLTALFAFLAFSVTCLFAQNSDAGLNSEIGSFATSFTNSFSKVKVSFEVFGGMNLSKITGFENNKVKFGWQLGGGVRIPLPVLDGKLSLNPQLAFIAKGTKKEISGPITMKTTESPYYLEIPVKVGYSFNPLADKPRFGLTVYAGPYFAYGIAGKHVTKTPNDSFWGSAASDNKNDFFRAGYGKRFDCGLVLGVKAGDEIFFDLSYERGFTNVYAADKKYSNSSFLFGIGYRF